MSRVLAITILVAGCADGMPASAEDVARGCEAVAARAEACWIPGPSLDIISTRCELVGQVTSAETFERWSACVATDYCGSFPDRVGDRRDSCLSSLLDDLPLEAWHEDYQHACLALAATCSSLGAGWCSSSQILPYSRGFVEHATACFDDDCGSATKCLSAEPWLGAYFY